MSQFLRYTDSKQHQIQLYHMDCLEGLRNMEAESVSAIVTDPPYGIKFLSQGWDYGVPDATYWKAALRVAKPGTPLLAFGGTRTHHRLACAIEDAGWQIRDCIMWAYGTGFPKSHNISKALDRVADDAWEMWDGWGTALKPAYEIILVAMKPLDGSYADNAAKHGVAGLNINGSRIEYASESDKAGATPQGVCTSNSGSLAGKTQRDTGRIGFARPKQTGRWPANLIHDGSEEVIEAFSDATRFFYCAKASKSERGEGNTHPTVKPLALMEYLCKLVSMPNQTGTLLDPFCGSGSILLAANPWFENVIGIEKDRSYYNIAVKRCLERK